jgi:hypothetical protein
MIDAGSGFVRARQTERTGYDDRTPVMVEMVEMFEASLELMWATDTDDLESPIRLVLAIPI